MSTIVELGARETADGITIRRLDVRGYQGRRAPGIIVTPANATGARPVILYGHGMAKDGKRSERAQRVAAFVVHRYSWAVAILDGPFHGDRVPASVARIPDGPEFREATWQYELTRDFAIGLAADWSAMIDALGELPDCDTERIGYVGGSFGSLVGLPVVAAEPRIRCAVFVVGGISGRPQFEGLWNAGDALDRAAASIGDRQVLLLNQSEDETFPREYAFRIYDALTGPKRIIFFPGGHGDVPEEAYEQGGDFLRRYLAGVEAGGTAVGTP